ncbi:MAG: hypothetical protein E7G54_01875 [Streptococcus sp.]|nr:hypothetical protein [Streptococcus sp.]
MVTFNEAMLSNDRALAIRVGDFTSENIKSANFKYGYITGDDFTPGGTYAGTASILFTSIVESFKKLDVVYPEIGLLVGSKVEWVKMGKYYIDDIKIDRNANTTEIELMDEMFKLNESFKTDLKYPAQIRDVILEIATKTGVTLASDNFGMTAIQQHVPQPTGDKLTFRDVLGQVSQLLGFSCFFNRNGELEVRGLTESGITITADNYFLHGLEKSEVEYQIAGITCEVTNNEKLTVGLQTGRSLEIENPLATQDTLNLLYYALKDIVYYPYDLSYQGHLKLDVGQWVTIKTNKDETLKVPVLYQSFSFSGGLTSTISADSVAGSDAQYTYGSFVTKKIDQKSTQIQAEVQQQLKYADEEFKKVSNEMLQQSLEYQNSVRNELATSKAELETQIDTAKTQAESNAKAYADEINQATAEVAKQANTAANSLKSDLAKVKTDLTATTSTANAAKTSASEAKQQLTTVANDLSTAKQDLQAQASQLTAQASAQSELTKRVSTVEETANGTKTTVSELSKTVDSNTKNITSVTARTKTVEDDLTSTKTTLSQVKTTANSANQKTATLETGLNGVKADLTATTTTANTTKTSLANYQASNDKAVANLQSNLQTANGNISSLQTKVEAVPGQITSAVSAVEGKIPTEIGGRNYIQNYGLTASGWKTVLSQWEFEIIPDSTSKSGQCLRATCTQSGAGGIHKVLIDLRGTEWQNRKMTYSIDVKASKSIQMNLGVEVFTESVQSFGVSTDWQRFSYSSTTNFRKNYSFVFYSVSNNNAWEVGDVVYLRDVQLEDGTIATAPKPAVEDTQSDITKLNTTLTQTANGLKQLSTQVTSQGNTITSHTNSINSLTTGLSAKVSQTDFNTLSGRVTTAENNITAKANELSSKISSAISTVEGKLEAIDQLNLIGAYNLTPQNATFDKTDYTLTSTTTTNTKDGFVQLQFFDTKNVVFTGFNLSEKVGKFAKSFKITKAYEHFRIKINGNASDASVWCYDKDLLKLNTDYVLSGEVLSLSADGRGNGGKVRHLKIQEGKVATGFSKAPQDVDSDISKVTSEFKQTTDSIKASVSALDKSTVKSASLTINTDGIVMKAGKSTTDVANAIGSYFAVNQNAINLFSDKINVKGNMIVSGAITSDKIASKSINTAHLNGKMITADVIATGAITTDAIKAGAVTTDKMTANSINGDRIIAGTLDAVKIKAGSITASQIASGTITSSQIKTGTISAANIAAGAITTNHLATGSITADKIKAGSITSDMFRGNKITSLNNATTLNLQTGEIIFNNHNATINQTKGRYKSQIRLFSLNDKASTESSWSSVNALAFNSTNLTSATRRVGLTTDMFPNFSEMTLYGRRIAFTDETSVAPGPKNSIIITTNLEEVDFINGLTNNSKGAWNYSMIMNFGTKAVINVPDIKLDGHFKSLTGILDDLCKKVGIMWV